MSGPRRYGWPESGQPMSIEFMATRSHASTVLDDVLDDGFLLSEAFTVDHAVLPAPAVGSELRLSWTTPAGWSEADAVMVGTAIRQIALWQVRFVGEPKLNQRREYARAPESLPVRLTVGDERARGVARSLSEGGLLCVLEQVPAFAPGAQAVVEMVMEDRMVRASGQVLSVQPEPDGRAVMRMRFDPLGKAEGNVIRRRVLDQQRRARAMQ